VSVLVLLGLIVCVFLLTGGLFSDVVNRVPFLKSAKAFVGISEKPLFVAEPQNMQPPAPPHEMRQAMAMLPELPAPWKRSGVMAVRVEATSDGARSASAGSPDKALGFVLDDFGATWTYRASYESDKNRVDVTIADAGTPEAAFGIWRALQPKGGKNLSIGRGGWHSDTPLRLAFWAGRYFTHIAGRTQSTTEAVDTVGRAIASIQIAYGGPFWAEAVLPREGQVEGSLRYEVKRPLGLDELSDCWLADYAEGVTIGVMHPADGQRMLATLRERFSRVDSSSTRPAGDAAAHNEALLESSGTLAKGTADTAVAHQSEPLAAGAVTGRMGDKLLTAFEAGPYVFVVLGGADHAEKIAGTAKMLHDRWSGAHGAIAQVSSPSNDAKPPAAHAKSASGGAKFAEVGGNIVAPTKIERFTDNLYEKIDGREGQFRAYHFVELRFGQYVDTRAQQAFDVYIYDIAEPVNAMGIYMTERSTGAESLEIGREGYVSGSNVYFWKGKYYVNVLGPAEGGAAGLAASRQIALAIAESIADTGGTMWAEELLPKEDRVPNSFKYRATSALSYDFLEHMYLADYKTIGKAYTMFVMKTASPAAGRELFKKLAEATAKYDKIVSREPSEDGETMVSDSLGIFAVAFNKGVFLGGVVECDDQELAVKRAAALRASMPKDAAGEPESPAASQPAESGKDAKKGDNNEH